MAWVHVPVVDPGADQVTICSVNATAVSSRPGRDETAARNYPRVWNQRWLALFLQVQTMSWVPLVVEKAGSSRQYLPPLAFSTNSPLARCVQISFAAPLQAYRITLLPLPPKRWSLAHLPLWTSSPPENDQPCAWSWELQVQIWILVRSAEPLPASSTHLPPYPL